MKVKQSKGNLSRRKFVSLFAAFALTMSMVVVLPATAFADDPPWTPGPGSATTGSFSPGSATVDAVVGTPCNLLDTLTITGTNGTAHRDFSVPAGNPVATINKHSGILTPLAAGVVTVTVCLTPDEAPNGVNLNPCWTPSLAVGTIQVTVSANSGSYGFQGNDQAIMLTSPSVLSWAPVTVTDPNNVVTVVGYTNQLGTIAPSNGVLTFAYSQSFGIGGNTQGALETWLDNNSDNVLLCNSSGTPIANATLDNTNIFTLAPASSANSNNMILTIDPNAANLQLGQTYILRFTEDYVAGNGTSELGVQVDFVFEYVYGPQGTDLTLTLTNPAVTSWVGNDANGYTNQLGTIPSPNDVLTFTWNQSFGIGGNIGTFISNNANNVVLLDSNGTVVVDGNNTPANLGNSAFSLSTGASNSSLILNIDGSANTGLDLASGMYTLQFAPGFIAGNNVNTLGTTLNFVFFI